MKMEDKIKNWPRKSGVYLMMNSRNQVVYIGKAKNLYKRILSYFSSAKGLKTQFLMNQVSQLDYILTQTETEAYLLEASLVKKHKPRYNVRLKDDKSYPYICLSMKDAFPRFYLERKVKRNGNIYFGPYAGGGMVRHMIRFLNETYQIRDCSNSFMKSRKTPCLTYQIGHCTAPCVKKEVHQTYGDQVRRALSFLRGHGVSEVKNLKKRMNKEAEKENFEQALELRDRISSIETVWEKQFVLDTKQARNLDVLAYFIDGASVLFGILNIRSGRLIGYYSHFEKNWVEDFMEVESSFISFLIQYYSQNLIPEEILIPSSWKKDSIKHLTSTLKLINKIAPSIRSPETKKEKQWFEMAKNNAENKFQQHYKKMETIEAGLKDIQKTFKLSRYPQRMECYDISHHQAKASYGSQVVFENGVPQKQDYRLYKLEDVNNDYQSMETCLDRRFSKENTDLPDLILIDGGKGQLQVAYKILQKKHLESIPLVAIAKPQKNQKQIEKFYIPFRKNPIQIPENKKSFQILVQMRDEAHRFALTRHKKKLRSMSFSSSLTSITGIGEKRREKLLKAFKSMDELRQSSATHVAKTIGISQKLAQKIIDSIQ